MSLDRTPPEVGSAWRERRRMYAKRIVLVQSVDAGFVYVLTLINSQGEHVAIKKANGEIRKCSRIRLRPSWEPA